MHFDSCDLFTAVSNQIIIIISKFLAHDNDFPAF